LFLILFMFSFIAQSSACMADIYCAAIIAQMYFLHFQSLYKEDAVKNNDIFKFITLLNS